MSSSSSIKETKRRGRDRTAELEVVAAPTGLEELKEALAKLFWELIPNNKVRESGYSRTQSQEFPGEEVGVAKALIAIRSLLDVHSLSTSVSHSRSARWK